MHNIIMAKLANIAIGDCAILAAVTMLMTLYHHRIGTDNNCVALWYICSLYCGFLYFEQFDLDFMSFCLFMEEM